MHSDIRTMKDFSAVILALIFKFKGILIYNFQQLSIFIVKLRIQTIRIFARFTIQTLNLIFVSALPKISLICELDSTLIFQS